MYICLYIYKPMTKWLATWAKKSGCRFEFSC